MERDDRRPRPEDRPPPPALYRPGAAGLCPRGPALTGEPDTADPARGRRFLILFAGAGVAFAGAAVFFALFRGVTAFEVIDLPGMLYLVGAAILVVLLDTLVSAATRLAQARRPRRPFAYRAWPDERGGDPVTGLVVVMVTVQLATLIAVHLVGLLALGALAFDRSLAAALFRAFVLVLVAGTLAGIILSAAVRIERLVSFVVRRVNPAQPSDS